MKVVKLKGRLLCKKCLIDDGSFRGGGSWSPDCCPKCGGTECVQYENLGRHQKLRSLRINKKIKEEETIENH